VPLFLIIQMLLLPQINVIHLDQLLQKNSFISNYLNVYPVIVFTKPNTGQILFILRLHREEVEESQKILASIH
jgi:hypothetical protein